uniref:Uncharacterized protein n=1 Tax=Zea mays TaxID=4577 RepID=C0P7K7_MAIZE|nr:unknown [Zea mays]
MYTQPQMSGSRITGQGCTGWHGSWQAKPKGQQEEGKASGCRRRPPPQQRRRGSILWWRRSQTSARAPFGEGSRASLSVSARCSISHITCTSSYAHVWTSSWSFTRTPWPPSACTHRQARNV